MRTYNEALGLVAETWRRAVMPSREHARAPGSPSAASTVRKILRVMAERDVIRSEGAALVSSSSGGDGALSRGRNGVRPAAHVERLFMEWMLRDDARPGTAIHEVELARQFGVATSGIREFLNGFAALRTGHQASELRAGSSRVSPVDFALELFKIREMFELAFGLRLRGAAGGTRRIGPRLRAVRDEHTVLLGLEIDARFQDFSALDSRFIGW